MNKELNKRQDKWQRRLLILSLLAAPLSFPLPGEAILGERADLVRTYFNGKKDPVSKKVEPTRAFEKRQVMEAFATARTELKPQSLFLYTDAQGLIQRELWIAPPQGMWTLEQADRIRNAIMAGRSLKGSVRYRMVDRQFIYSDGSWVRYSVKRGQVYSILALSSSFNPGDLGKLPPNIQLKKKIIKPRS